MTRTVPTAVRRGVVCAASALLVACATPTLRPALPDTQWSADGRLSISTVTEQGPRLDTGRFDWRQSSDASEIALYSPFGQTVGEVRVGPHGATVRTPDRTESAADADALLARTVGVALPVTGLRHWLRGEDTHGAQRAPAPFDEAGWRVAYPQMSADAPTLPRIVTLERSQPLHVEVRVVIDHWSDAHP